MLHQSSGKVLESAGFMLPSLLPSRGAVGLIVAHTGQARSLLLNWVFSRVGLRRPPVISLA